MTIENDSDIRLKKLYNALKESRDGHPFWDFIDQYEVFDCLEYLIAESCGKDFIDNWEYLDVDQLEGT